MADEVSGGIVTTVRNETTQDLDVLAIMAANKEEGGESQPNTPAAKAEEKAGEAKPPTAEGKDEKKGVETPAKEDEFDETKPLDFKSLSPRDQKLVGKAMSQYKKDMRRTNDDLRQRLAAVEAKLPGEKSVPAAQPQPVVTVQEPVQPKRRSFPQGEAGDDQYEAAMKKYTDAYLDFRETKKVAEQRQIAQQQADQEVISKFQTAAEKFAEEHPDYDDVMDSNVPITPIMFGYMLEEGPALGYYFGTHPEEAEKLTKMTDRQQEKTIARLLVKLEDEAKGAPPKTETKAPERKKPEPITPVAARGATVVAKDPSKMTFKEREAEYARTHPGQLNYM